MKLDFFAVDIIHFRREVLFHYLYKPHNSRHFKLWVLYESGKKKKMFGRVMCFSKPNGWCVLPLFFELGKGREGEDDKMCRTVCREETIANFIYFIFIANFEYIT